MGSAMENHYEQLYLVGGLEHVFSIQLGTSSSQLTNSIIFQRGWNDQPEYMGRFLVEIHYQWGFQ